MKKTLFKVNRYTEYRVFTELKYLNLYGCNAYPKFYDELASVGATVYERVKDRLKSKILGLWSALLLFMSSKMNLVLRHVRNNESGRNRIRFVTGQDHGGAL